MKKLKHFYVLAFMLAALLGKAQPQREQVRDRDVLQKKYSDRSIQSYVMASVALGVLVVAWFVRRRKKIEEEENS